MSLATRTAGVLARMGAHPVQVRRRMTVRAPGLQVRGAVLAGSTAVTIDGPGLTGAVPAGCRLRFGSDATVYATTAEATAVDGAIAITVSPALVLDVADNAAVTVTRAYGETEFSGWKGRQREERANGGVSAMEVTYFAAVRPDGFRVRHGDFLYDPQEPIGVMGGRIEIPEITAAALWKFSMGDAV